MTPPGTVSATDQATLVNYLDNGGNLYIESVNLGMDHTTSNMLIKCGVKFQDDGTSYDVDTLFSQNQELMEAVDYFYGGGASPHYSVDRLLPNGSSILYSSNDGFPRLFLLDNETYKVISSSIVFGALVNSENLSLKPYLMAEMINYFLGVGTITGITDLLNGNNETAVSSFPNPFSSSTNIKFTLLEDSFVEIEVFDALGKLVTSLRSENLPAGEHSVVWDATTSEGRQVERGFYFYNVKMNDQQYSGKMIFNR